MVGCCVINSNKESFQELEKFINELPEKKGALILVLHKAQSIFGYLPKEVQVFVADKLGLPKAKVYGVVNFYSFFTMVPKGENPISVCMGTACYIKGSEKILNELKKELGIGVGQVTEDRKFSIDTLRCVGACGLAPVLMVGEKVYGRVSIQQVKNILKKYKYVNK